MSTRALFEGHARWADTAVSTELFGRPPVTWGHREAGEPRPCLRTRVRGACLRALPFKLLKGNHYEDGARFIEHLVSHGGPELVNRVWTCPDLVPTTDEVDRPQEWIARATAPVAVTTPQQ